VEGADLTDRVSRPGVLKEADEFVTRVHADVVASFIGAEHIDRASVAVIGFHGQTVIHKPAEKLTVQIGDDAALARKLKLPVAHDFRHADIMAGGQGAPLVPVFHQALARALKHPHPIAVLNIGGVANVTYVDGGDRQTGPGFHRRRARRPFLRSQAAEVARPQQLRLRQYRAAELFGAGRRGDVVGADGAGGQPHRAVPAVETQGLGRRRRRRAEPHTDEDARRAWKRPMHSRRRLLPFSRCVR
jgi:1,6-anhydro-N-acetylmuramate kinase